MELSTAKHIENYLAENRENMVLLLKKLVAEETPSADKEAQNRIMLLLKETLKEMDFYVCIVGGKKTGGYLYARPGHRVRHQPLQLLVGHCDTVWKKSTIEQMPITEADDKITGPGIFDMKAGLVQMIFAIKALKELDLPCKVTPVLLINSDEEIGSIESTRMITRLSRLANRAYILEPPLGLNGRLKTARKGIGKFILTVKGKSAHAGLNPDKGVSAIVELSYHIQNLFSLNDFEKGITVNVGMIQGGSSANVIAAESKAVIDVRVNNLADADFITRKIMGLKPVHEDSELRVEGRFGRPPMEKTNRNRQLWKLARDVGKTINLNLKEAKAGGGSDGNTTSLYTATLDGLGTVGDGAHANHEFIFTEKLVERTALLTLLLSADPLAGTRV